MNSQNDASQIIYRRAENRDLFRLLDLYTQVYNGNYSDEEVTQPKALRRSFAAENKVWLIAEQDSKIIGCMHFTSDTVNGFTKAAGAVVDSQYRSQGVADSLMKIGLETVRSLHGDNQLFFALVRTLTTAPQKLTAHHGFKVLGVFPNIHRTDQYETHCLVGILPRTELNLRATHFKLHPAVSELFKLVAKSNELPELPLATSEDLAKVVKGSSKTGKITYETIQAPNFIQARFAEKKSQWMGHQLYSSFELPNILFVSDDQSLEIFGHYSEKNLSCSIMAIIGHDECGLDMVLCSLREHLHSRGLRYLEIGMRAEDLTLIEMALRADFIPCAYFPALEKVDSQRNDFVFLSLSFEAFNFNRIQISGMATDFLEIYLKVWSQQHLMNGPCHGHR